MSTRGPGCSAPRRDEAGGNRTLLIPLLVSVVVAVPFALTAGNGGRTRNPACQTVSLMTRASLIDLAPVFQSTPEALLRNLRQRGYKATSTAESPSAIAIASSVGANEVLFSLMPARHAANPESNQSSSGFTRLPEHGRRYHADVAAAR